MGSTFNFEDQEFSTEKINVIINYAEKYKPINLISLNKNYNIFFTSYSGNKKEYLPLKIISRDWDFGIITLSSITIIKTLLK